MSVVIKEGEGNQNTNTGATSTGNESNASAQYSATGHEYIKLFRTLESADNFRIESIPWITTVSGGNGTLQNLVCNEPGKRTVVIGNTVYIVGDGIPYNELWYTSSDGNIITPYKTSSLPEIDTNTYSDGKGIIKFKTNVTSIGSNSFVNRTSLTSITIPNSVTSVGFGAFHCGINDYSGSLQTISVGETVFAYDGESQYFTITLGDGTDVELTMWTLP